MKEQSGFTLVELMVVVSITVLLLAWGIPSYSTWSKKHNIESQMVQLYSDLQFGRMTAYSSKAVSGVYWGGGTSITQYWIKSDKNSNNTIDDNVDATIGAKVTPKFAITSSASQNSVSFDGRGFLNIVNSGDPAPAVTFYVAPSYGAGMDCVAVTSTRITLGKMSGGSCAPK